MKENLDNLRKVLNQAVFEAGDILLKYFGEIERIDKKGEVDLLTVADKESENKIIEIIKAEFPSHQILAEESGQSVKSVNERYRWIIDPLDGTTNYAHKFPVFAVSIGVEFKGEIVLGGVYNPCSKEYFVAEKESGATLNGNPIKVSQTSSLDRSLIVTGFPYDRRSHADYYLRYYKEFMMRTHGVRRVGAAALDLCFVAAGRMDGFWEEKLHPWDTAAGYLIVIEAGGRVTDFWGQPYSPFKKQILATNGRIHNEMLEVFARVPPRSWPE